MEIVYLLDIRLDGSAIVLDILLQREKNLMSLQEKIGNH
jgi:hypothetical protein